MIFFPIVYRMIHLDFGTVKYFPAVWKEKKSECEEACAPSALPHWLLGCQKVKDGQRSSCSSIICSPQAFVSVNAIIVSGCPLEEMLHLWLLQKHRVALLSEEVFTTLPFAEDGWLADATAGCS